MLGYTNRKCIIISTNDTTFRNKLLHLTLLVSSSRFDILIKFNTEKIFLRKLLTLVHEIKSDFLGDQELIKHAIL